MLRRTPACAAALLLGVAGCGDKMVMSDGLRDAAGPPPDTASAPTFAPGIPAAPGGGPPAGGGPEPGSAVACPGTETVEPASCASIGVMLSPPYDTRYSCFDLGPVPGVMTTKYGGVTLTADRCSSSLIIGVNANAFNAKLYSVGVTRDVRGHVNGFSGMAAPLIDAPYHDGGVAYGPGGVLFITRYPVNQIQQTKPGSTAVDKVISLGTLLVSSSAASLNFVPARLPGAGMLKLVTFSGGDFYTLLLSPDGEGTYDIVGAKLERRLTGGPEGFVYVAAGSPLISVNSLLVSEWSARRISIYETDQGGNPKLDTVANFITGLNGAEGAYRDPATGDFFFSTWGHAMGDRVIVVRGFAPMID
jgi:hypothetical protein